MSTEAPKRLSNSKTRTETGLESVLHNINTLTPYGTRKVKEIKPFMPGREVELRHEFDKLDLMIGLIHDYPSEIEQLTEIFMEIKEIAYTLDRSIKNVLSVVELYEIKTFLLQTKKALDLLSDISHNMPLEFKLHDTVTLLDTMDPGKDRINTFYIYDQFSEKLGSLRKEKREIELEIRKELKQVRRKLEQEYKFQMTPKCELLVPKSDEATMKLARGISEIEQVEEDYMTITFKVKANDAVYELQKKMSDLNEAIDEEELAVRTTLSQKIAKEADVLKKNCEHIGNLDFVLAKAFYAQSHDCVRPTIVNEHILKIEDGRHLLVEEVLKKKHKQYCPVSVDLGDGVSCITGANMGGKTISLKMIGLVAIMAQYGFFVPCKSASIGLSNYMHILIGDSQNVQRGLSSFGSEMEELREILDNSKDRSLLLIDEIASGTNPVEGLALTKSLIRYLIDRTYITVITTHFDHAAVGNKVHNMQVRGLADADFNRLAKELAHANRKERIEIVGRYMDYRLYTVKNEEQIPKDALNIARILGIYDEIIDYAREIMQSDK
ncbi:MutS-related protein [Anaerovorax sp. IOR16]|uniref:lysine 5,6-aminomutase reactivase ATPase KamC n=1 Tax=Anaerovorax sp. IOR16 TaxID=2773458 RepID=UPI0019CF7A40|nr:DNA mismatch repair protein MutS [Anaerovorax sp. IOR16]